MAKFDNCMFSKRQRKRSRECYDTGDMIVDFKKLHGLVVEDSKVMQKVLVKGLQNSGYSCDIANDGLEAVNILIKNSSIYDFITMDVNMPNMDGLEATTRIRSELNLVNIPIIVLSSEDGDMVKTLSKEARATAFVEKPVNIGEFTAWVGGLCRQ